MITTVILIALPLLLIIGYIAHHANKYPKYQQVRWMLISIVGENWTGIYDYDTMYQYQEAFEEVKQRYKLNKDQFDLCLQNLYDESWFRNQSFLRDGST